MFPLGVVVQTMPQAGQDKSRHYTWALEDMGGGMICLGRCGPLKVPPHPSLEGRSYSDVQGSVLGITW